MFTLTVALPRIDENEPEDSAMSPSEHFNLCAMTMIIEHLRPADIYAVWFTSVIATREIVFRSRFENVLTDFATSIRMCPELEVHHVRPIVNITLG